ncbi:hypothetical protein HMI48_11000 [Acidithiobacillus ferrooxidans]|uniref:hypothetical protein n=1 Tax=Acidithiobacillus ferrooxidans TaxID=920 RepID=UPI00017F70FD|nr:hypothetical protein [Acidithiobacillus ferrooxidans]ACH83641.1 hypothetical protein Lferr_1409 [Acidithiobacillus ferrooxidans ATCC 53993]MBU2774376.1 hypothetical protein [Acidithiobacillus ferrooxidans]
MFGFGEHNDHANVQQVTCTCGTNMAYQGAHGLRMGGLTGMLGAGAAFLGGQVATDGEEAFEKKLEVDIYVCPQCQDVRLKYRKGL